MPKGQPALQFVNSTNQIDGTDLIANEIKHKLKQGIQKHRE